MPGYAAVKCRLVVPVGHTYHASWYWKDGADHEHSASVPIDEATYALGLDAAHSLLRMNGTLGRCKTCGALPPEEMAFGHGLSSRRLWSTEDGDLHPGDMFWVDWMDHDGKCREWDNCDGRHLRVVLPNDNHWDIDSRASNCTMPNDRRHRCWVRVGEPPLITVGKNGRTCGAGAGSIMSGDYHGFLRGGVLTAG